MKGRASLSQSGAYNQEAFRSLLESESKRCERSGHFCQILLLYWTDAQGSIVQIRSLRDTDYIGWYRDGRVIGAVLTVLAQDSMAQLFTHLQPRLAEHIRGKLGVEEISRLQIRVCRQYELESIESGEGTLAVN